MRLKELLENVSYTGCVNPEAEIADVCTRPEAVYPGTLFVAVRGRRTDSHLFIDAAVENGASCVVCEDARYIGYLETSVCVVDNSREALAKICANFFKRPAEKLTMIGVTGTNGKTTVCAMTEHILTQFGKNVGVIGTLASDYHETTPEARMLHSVLSGFVCAGCEIAVAEVSSQGLDQHRTAGIPFKVGLFTNLGHDHLDYHGDMESYFSAKAKLADQCETFLINADDVYAGRLKNLVNAKTFSVKENADFRAADLSETENGLSFSFVSAQKSVRVFAPVFGTHNVYNMLSALAICETVCPESVTETCLSGFSGVRGRLERVSVPVPYEVYIDFAHTPTALESVLKTLKSRCKNRLLLVFGCGGERDREKRPEMAEIAKRYADLVYVTNDNPRREDPNRIFSDILSGFSGSDGVLVTEDRKEAIRRALSDAEAGDVVLLAGKGHETTQILSDGVHPFDEREIIKEYFEGE